MNASVEFTALAAENDLRETVLAGVAVPFAVIAGVDNVPADQFFLNQKKDVLRDNRFMVALHVVLRDGAVVLDAFFRQEARGIGLLQERITDVLFVAENLVDGAGMPLHLARAD